MAQSPEVRLRPYEGLVIMHPDATLDQQKGLFKKNKEIIEAHKGTVNHIDTWGKRPLANTIQKSKKGVFFHVTFEADNKAVAELERTMRINERVLRFVHLRLKDGTSLPQYMEKFKKDLTEAVAREKEREVKIQQKKAARAQAYGNA